MSSEARESNVQGPIDGPHCQEAPPRLVLCSSPVRQRGQGKQQHGMDIDQDRPGVDIDALAADVELEEDDVDLDEVRARPPASFAGRSS